MKEKKSRLQKIIERIEDPEYKEKSRQKRLDNKNTLTTERQFGFFVGETIIAKYLPQLSIDTDSGKVVQVSDEDEKKYKDAEKKWFRCDNEEEKQKFWLKYYNLRQTLIKKYLPKALICHFDILSIINEDEFKKGLIESLWNSDICEYSLNPDDIKIYDDEKVFFTIIELNLPNIKLMN